MQVDEFIYYLFINFMDSEGSEKKSMNDDAPTRKVFITNLDFRPSLGELEDELKKLFKEYGKIDKLNVKRAKNQRYSFAFLEYDKVEDASKAIKELDQHILHGKAMRV